MREGRITATEVRTSLEMIEDSPALNQISNAYMQAFCAAIMQRLDQRLSQFEQRGPTFSYRYPDDISEDVVEAHAPVPEMTPAARKESYDEWMARATALIDENTRNRE